MSNPITRDLADDYDPYKQSSRSTGRDDESGNEGNISKIVIDFGKGVNSIALCAAICGMCLVGFFWVEHRVSVAEKEARLVEYYLMDASSRTPEELKAWAKLKSEQGR